MDLGLYGRVIWRFKWLMALGLIIGVGGAYLLYEGGAKSYSSHTQVFITQSGFTWGASGQVRASSGAGTSPTPAGGTSAGASSSVLSPYVPGVDPQRLSSLASLYAQLASGSAVRAMLPAAYRNMLLPPSGEPTASLYASAVSATEYSTPAILPLVTFWATAPSPAVAVGLATAATDAFQRLVASQQAGVAPKSQVVAQVVQNATRATPVGHKSKSLPMLVFLAALIGSFGLALALENTHPRSSGRSARRLVPRRRGSSASGATVPAGAPVDGPAETLAVAEPGTRSRI